jgi:hypothetical protein
VLFIANTESRCALNGEHCALYSQYRKPLCS